MPPLTTKVLTIKKQQVTAYMCKLPVHHKYVNNRNSRIESSKNFKCNLNNVTAYMCKLPVHNKYVNNRNSRIESSKNFKCNLNNEGKQYHTQSHVSFTVCLLIACDKTLQKIVTKKRSPGKKSS